MTRVPQALRVFAGMCLLAAVGCSVNFAGSKSHDWVGHHRDELIKIFGPPSQEAVLGQGGKSLVYLRTQGSPNYFNEHLNTCRMVFNTDAHGTIKSWAYYSC
jgi:hypothetical protein